VVFCVDDAFFGGMKGVEGGLHGGAFEGPVRHWEVLEDEHEDGDPEEEPDHPTGCGMAAEASVEGAKLSGCGLDFRGGLLDDLLGLCS
jgi:hypothetical protein